MGSGAFLRAMINAVANRATSPTVIHLGSVATMIRATGEPLLQGPDVGLRVIFLGPQAVAQRGNGAARGSVRDGH